MTSYCCDFDLLKTFSLLRDGVLFDFVGLYDMFATLWQK